MIDVFTKYAWVKPLKDEKFKTVLHSFIKIVNEFKRTPNKLWVDQGGEFYDNFMQKWLVDNDILIYLIHNDGKLVVNERFIRVKFKKNAANDNTYYLKFLNKLVDECNNPCYCSIGEKPIDADYSALPEELRQIIKLLSLSLVAESKLLNKKIFLAKVTLKIGRK